MLSEPLTATMTFVLKRVYLPELKLPELKIPELKIPELKNHIPG